MGDELDAILADPHPREGLRTLRTVALWVAGLLVIFMAMGFLRAPSLPDKAPAFSLPTLEGDTLALAEFRGQTVVLNFWATWCGPCLLEIPWFSDYADGHPEVALLGIATDGPAEKVAAAAQQLEMTYPVLMSDDATHEAYGISTIPTTVIVDAEGRVRYAHSGLLMGWQLRALVWWFG